jgi:hypothetical protein
MEYYSSAVQKAFKAAATSPGKTVSIVDNVPFVKFLARHTIEGNVLKVTVEFSYRNMPCGVYTCAKCDQVHAMYERHHAFAVVVGSAAADGGKLLYPGIVCQRCVDDLRSSITSSSSSSRKSGGKISKRIGKRFSFESLDVKRVWMLEEHCKEFDFEAFSPMFDDADISDAINHYLWLANEHRVRADVTELELLRRRLKGPGRLATTVLSWGVFYE